jgi:hypothetical protein
VTLVPVVARLFVVQFLEFFNGVGAVLVVVAGVGARRANYKKEHSSQRRSPSQTAQKKEEKKESEKEDEEEGGTSAPPAVDVPLGQAVVLQQLKAVETVAATRTRADVRLK